VGALSKAAAGLIVPPPTAVSFGLVRLLTRNDKGKRAKVLGEPQADGHVPERWPVAEFDTAKILEAFGPDNYRVDWYDNSGKRIKGQTFVVAHAPSGGARIDKPRRGRTPARAERGDDEEPRERGRDPDAISFRELLMMQAEDRKEQERREERADQRRREEGERAQQRDREFMATVMGALMQTRAAPDQGADLLRRELSLEIRQGMAQLRTELGGNEPEEEPDDPNEPPSLEGVGAAILGELEARAPHLVGELLPEVGKWLQSKGFAPSADLQAQLAGAVKPNGRGHAGPS
jgi:hypothetical protein